MNRKIYAPVCLVCVKTHLKNADFTHFYVFYSRLAVTMPFASFLFNYVSICDGEQRKKDDILHRLKPRGRSYSFLVKIQVFPLFLDFLCECDKHQKCGLNNNGEEGMFYCLSSFHFSQFRAMTFSTRECKFSVSNKFRTSPN